MWPEGLISLITPEDEAPREGLIRTPAIERSPLYVPRG